MTKRKADIRIAPTTPLLGFAVIVGAILCFIIAMWVLVAIVRIVMG